MSPLSIPIKFFIDLIKKEESQRERQFSYLGKSAILSDMTYYINQYIMSDIAGVDDNDIAVMLLCTLYHNKRINKTSFCNYMQKYQSGELTRTFESHHSRLSDKWYTECSFVYVLYDNVKLITNPEFNIPADIFIDYLNLGFNKKRNWCVNYIETKLFAPVFGHHHYHKDLVSDFLTETGYPTVILQFDVADKIYDFSFGHCCYDCSGDLNEYKLNAYRTKYQNSLDEPMEAVQTALSQRYKPNKSK